MTMERKIPGVGGAVAVVHDPAKKARRAFDHANHSTVLQRTRLVAVTKGDCEYYGISAGLCVRDGELDCVVAGKSRGMRCDNSRAGLSRLIEFLRRHHVQRVGLEAGNDSQTDIVRQLRATGFEVVVFQSADINAVAELAVATH